MASIYGIGNDRWVVQWSAGRDRNGKTIRDSRTFTDRERAIHFKVEIEMRNTGTGKEPLASRALAWIEHRQAIGKISEKTAVGYREKLAAWGRLLGNAPYKKLTARDIERAYGRLAAGDTPTGRVPSARTLHHYRAAIRAFFNHMEKAGEVSHNPTRALEAPGGLRDKTRRAPTRDELIRMLAVADDSKAQYGQLGLVMRLAAHIGLRRGEICALRWSDVNFDSMVVSVARAATQPKGRDVYFKEPKSAAGIRRISMLEPTAQLLREQRKRIAAWRLRAGTAWADNDLIVCDPFGQVLNPEELSKAARTVRDRAGVSRDVSPLHGGRHYSLTQLHKAGIDSITIKARAGHADIRSTVGYITIDDDDDRKAAAAVRDSLL